MEYRALWLLSTFEQFLLPMKRAKCIKTSLFFSATLTVVCFSNVRSCRGLVDWKFCCVTIQTLNLSGPIAFRKSTLSSVHAAMHALITKVSSIVLTITMAGASDDGLNNNVVCNGRVIIRITCCFPLLVQQVAIHNIHHFSIIVLHAPFSCTPSSFSSSSLKRLHFSSFYHVLYHFYF